MKSEEIKELTSKAIGEVGLGFEISTQKLVVVPNVPNFAPSGVQESRCGSRIASGERPLVQNPQRNPGCHM
jgi:hypothetical protein